MQYCDSCAVCTRIKITKVCQRFGGRDIASNADMRPAQIGKYCTLDDPCQALMKTAMRQLELTARSYHRVLKLSRTIADLRGSEAITLVQLADALHYWPKLKLKKWLLICCFTLKVSLVRTPKRLMSLGGDFLTCGNTCGNGVDIWIITLYAQYCLSYFKI